MECVEHAAADAPGHARPVSALYAEHALGLVRLAVIMLGDQASAEDVVHDAFLALYRRRDRRADPATALPSLRPAVLDGCRAVLRRRDQGRHLLDGPERPGPDDASFLLTERQARILAAIRRLPDQQREAVVLRYHLDLDEGQAAEAMRASRGTVAAATSGGVAALGVEAHPAAPLTGEAEDRIRAATAAAAGTVREVGRPLDLAARPARPGGYPYRHPRRAGWLIPLTAAVMVAAIVAGLVGARRPAGGPVAGGPASARPAPGTIPAVCAADLTSPGRAAPPAPPAARSAPPVAGLPEYFVSPCDPQGSPWLVVGSTLTGAPLTAVALPPGWAPAGGYASDGDRAFLIGAVPASAPGTPGPRRWYLLRITPGQRVTATLTRAPVTIPAAATGVALSPDGTGIAIASSSPPSGTPPAGAGRGPRPVLALYSVATGGLLSRWQAASGQVVAVPGDEHAGDDKAMTLRWTADGLWLAFTWNGTSIRVLNAAGAAGGDLIANSGPAMPISSPAAGSGSDAPLRCDLTQGWAVADGGRWVTCAVAGGSWARHRPRQAGGCAHGSPTATLGIARFAAPDGRLDHVLYAVSAPCDPGQFGIRLAWAAPDGNTAVGQSVLPAPSGPLDAFGFMRGGRFFPLPASGDPGLMAALGFSYLGQ
jgi:RNA polymerase sigma factor (sigma-70 family)